jgi:hypothetical protein
LTIPIVDYKITKEIDLADVLGYPDFSDSLKDFQTRLDGFFADWKDLLKTADDGSNCDVATFIAKWGNKLADKIPKF